MTEWTDSSWKIVYRALCREIDCDKYDMGNPDDMYYLGFLRGKYDLAAELAEALGWDVDDDDSWTRKTDDGE